MQQFTKTAKAEPDLLAIALLLDALIRVNAPWIAAAEAQIDRLTPLLDRGQAA